MRKQFLFFLLALLPMAANADDSGSCGENVTWTYIESTHTITISGTGNTNNGPKSPFWRFGSDIIKAIIEDGVTSIGSSLFYGCSNLTSITLPNSLILIGGAAFMDCTSLTSITIPTSLKRIDDFAFGGCTNLKSVYISNLESWCNMSFSTVLNYQQPITYHLFLNGEEIKDLVIPQDVTSIAKYAFSGCIGLTSVTIPNNVKSIGENAFSRCDKLTSINLPDNITSIGVNAFLNCFNLVSVELPNSLTSINDGVFQGCSGLNNVTISNNVTSIGESAFSGCKSINIITLPDELNTIKVSAFEGCSKLKELVIPAKVGFIYKRAFMSCPSLEKVMVLSTNPPMAFDDSFSKYNIPLYIPEASVSAYQTTNPWSKFSEFKTLTGGDIETKVCEKPTISYKDGQILFSCATEDVEFKSNITASDIKDYSTASIPLSATYNISVIAVKSGYHNSETAKATLCWIDKEPKTEGITNGVASVRAMPVMIQSQGGILNITGAPEGSVINVYDLSGKMVESAISDSETTCIPTNLNRGEIGIVKIGDKCIKVVMQ